MVKSFRTNLLLILSLSLFGCSTPITTPSLATSNSQTIVNEDKPKSYPSIVRPQQCKATVAETKLCQSQGGNMVESGMRGCDMCTVQYSDAGKTCQDSSECMGKCVATDIHDNFGKTNVKGKCSSTNSPFGCYARIEKGQSQGVLCVD